MSKGNLIKVDRTALDKALASLELYPNTKAIVEQYKTEKADLDEKEQELARQLLATQEEYGKTVLELEGSTELNDVVANTRIIED